MNIGGDREKGREKVNVCERERERKKTKKNRNTFARKSVLIVKKTRKSEKGI